MENAVPMDDIVSSPPPANPKKRPAPDQNSPRKKPLNLKGDQFIMPTPPDTDQSSNTSPNVSIDNDEIERAASPAPSSALSSIVEIASSNAPPAAATPAVLPSISTSASGPPPAKRRKLTSLEKVEKQREKEAKDREKAELKALRDDEKRAKEEEKARKDEEKRAKEEEKARKDDEKREEKRVKDEEKRRKAEERESKKREKELEEERKAQDKLNKERKQMRLGAFFQQKPANHIDPSKGDENQQRARRRSFSLELYDDVVGGISSAASPARGTPPPMSAKKPVAAKSSKSDYQLDFLPFALMSHTTLAISPAEYSEVAQDAFDRELRDPSLQERYDLGMVNSYQGHAEISHYFEHEPNVIRGLQCPPIKELVEIIQGTSQQPIDLTDNHHAAPIDRLRLVPIKHIQFEEDVRPAYCGTYTKIKSPDTVRQVGRSPFTRARQDTNYDYDSEAEWEPPEEGDEEVLSDEEDEIDSQADANDMEFLDDEDDTTKNKRKMITGELVPENTGLCWASETGQMKVVESIEVEKQTKAMRGMSMGVLLPGFIGQTIDPFSTSYWQTPISDSAPGASSGLLVKPKPSGPMAPPRVPLQDRLNTYGSPQHDLIGAAQGRKGPITSLALQGAKRGPKTAPKTLNATELAEFKEAVVDSPLGKLELQKGLKSRFPKLTNEVIKEALSLQFAQVGKGKAERRWVFVGQT